MKLAKTNETLIECADPTFCGNDHAVWISNKERLIVGHGEGFSLQAAMRAAVAEMEQKHMRLDHDAISIAWKAIVAYQTPNPYRDPAEQEAARMEKEHYANA